MVKLSHVNSHTYGETVTSVADFPPGRAEPILTPTAGMGLLPGQYFRLFFLIAEPYGVSPLEPFSITRIEQDTIEYALDYEKKNLYTYQNTLLMCRRA